MCSSPKSNGSYIAPKKPTRAFLAALTSQQRLDYARIANQAQERREQKMLLILANEIEPQRVNRSLSNVTLYSRYMPILLVKFLSHFFERFVLGKHA